MACESTCFECVILQNESLHNALLEQVLCCINAQVELSRNAMKLSAALGDSLEGDLLTICNLFPLDASKYYQPAQFCTELDWETIIMGKYDPITLSFFWSSYSKCLGLTSTVLSCVVITLLARDCMYIYSDHRF